MNILDSRDLAKRLAELIDLRDVLTELQDELKARQDEEHPEANAMQEIESKIADAEADFGTDEAAELAELEGLESDVSEWSDGATLIDASDFVKYAQELADDIGAIDRDAKWPLNHIDWEAAAKELEQDYTTVTYLGTDYLVRA